MLDGEDAKGIFSLVSERMNINRARLIELDAELGDGDLGITMSRGFGGAAEAVERDAASTPGRVFQRAGAALASSAPSTMGTLIGTGLIRAGRAMQDKAELEEADLAAALTALVEGIQARGKARPGEKTILDSLAPAVETYCREVQAGRTMENAIRRAAWSAEEGMLRTLDMEAVHGRAAYYQEQSLGRLDPGAAVGFLIIEAIADFVAGRRARLQGRGASTRTPESDSVIKPMG